MDVNTTDHFSYFFSIMTKKAWAYNLTVIEFLLSFICIEFAIYAVFLLLHDIALLKLRQMTAQNLWTYRSTNSITFNYLSITGNETRLNHLLNSLPANP